MRRHPRRWDSAGTAAQGAAPASGSSPPAVSSSVGAIQDELSDLARARSSRCVEERSGNTWARWPAMSCSRRCP